MYRRGNKLVVGSTQSGKSYAEVHDLLDAAVLRNVAVVVVDPHARSLARNALTHLIARGQKSRIGFGGETIRHYVMAPQQYVKDARTGHTSGNPMKVLDGNLDPFIESYLRYRMGDSG